MLIERCVSISIGANLLTVPILPIALMLFYYFLFLVGETESTGYCGHHWPIVPAPDDTRRWWWLWNNRWNEDLSTTNPTRPDPGSNPDHRRGKPLTTWAMARPPIELTEAPISAHLSGCSSVISMYTYVGLRATNGTLFVWGKACYIWLLFHSSK
jgi:hypothetical protein